MNSLWQRAGGKIQRNLPHVCPVCSAVVKMKSPLAPLSLRFAKARQRGVGGIYAPTLRPWFDRLTTSGGWVPFDKLSGRAGPVLRPVTIQWLLGDTQGYSIIGAEFRQALIE